MGSGRRQRSRQGQVFAQGNGIGNATLSQFSFGLQVGGQAFSQIIFFQDMRALEEFTGGHFEFGGDIGVVVITAGLWDGGSLWRRCYWEP